MRKLLLLAPVLLNASCSMSPAPAPTQFEAIVLEHALASEVASAIAALAHSPSEIERIQVVADERTNSVLVSGTPEQVEQIHTLIAALDTAQ